MRRVGALLLIGMVWIACGKYGPPQRSVPATAPAAGAAAEPQDDEPESSQ